MASVISVSKSSRKNSWTIALLYCGIASSLFYIAMNIFVPAQYQGYSLSSQTVSELSAIDAPTRPLWASLAAVYSLLIIAFGWGVWKSAGEKRSLRIAGALIIAYSVIGLFWPPMHQREALAAGHGSLTDTLHIAFTFVTVPLMMLTTAFGAAAFGRPFRLYSIVSLLLQVLFGILTGTASPRLEADLPTPWMGVWERISIGVYMIWIIVFTILLLRREKAPDATSSLKANPEKIHKEFA